MGLVANARIRERSLRHAPLYSEELGISLKSGTERECFKWFLASLLFGARIGETIAKNTYRAFERHGLLSPRAIRDAGWDFLVNPIMREGGYVRYDGRKSTQILRICERLLEEYGGCITEVHKRALDARDLERRLQEFYGVGPVTTNIFLRELRPFWTKANPETLPQVRAIAREGHIPLSSRSRKSVAFARLEAGLIRMRRRARRKPGWHAARSSDRDAAQTQTEASSAGAARASERRRRRRAQGRGAEAAEPSAAEGRRATRGGARGT